MKKAFTLIELTVAVALLAMMISFASLIFDMSIDTYRTAIASAEIMQKLQAITGQLNADFKGLSINLPGKVLFSVVGQTRSDSIAFFANGDFQSTGQYNDGGGEKTVTGNVAIIYYGLAGVADANAIDPRERVLIRRQKILTSDSGLEDLDLDQAGEYYKSSLSQLAADETFEVNEMMVTWPLNLDDPNDLVTYMAEGVDDFTIQFAEWNGLKFVWPPKDESEFDDYPVIITSAFKFTFTLYDSKGILEEGKTFTHIVYLGD